MTEKQKPQRGRPPKSETVRKERRNRSGNLGGINSKLALPDELKNDKTHRYRWFNDVDGRIQDQVNYNEWDLVRQGDFASIDKLADKGSAISKRVGTAQDGSPLLAYLMKKPMQFSEEDRAQAQTAIDEKMNQIRKGARGTESEELHSHGYTPQEGIRLRG